MPREVREVYTKRGLTPPEGKHKGKHKSLAFHRIVAGIKSKGRANDVNPYAIAAAKLGSKKMFK